MDKEKEEREDNILLVEHRRWQADSYQRSQHNLKQYIFWACVVVVGSMSAGAALMSVFIKIT